MFGDLDGYLRTASMEGQTGRFRPEQVAQQSTWGVVPNEQMTVAAMHVIKQVPKGSTTVTTMNPLDPSGDRYFEHSGCPCEHTIPVGRMP